MGVEIAIFILAVTIAIGLPFGGSPMISALDRRQIDVEQMVRRLGLGCATGCVLGVVGLLLLLFSSYITIPTLTISIVITVIAFLAITSVLVNMFVILRIWKAYRGL